MNESQRVFRVKKDRNFTIVKNHFIDDTRLSLKATSILLIALRYPDNWKMSVKTMTKFKSDKESSVASGFKELVTFGYAEYRKNRDIVTGKLDYGWYFFEESQKPEVQQVPKLSKNKNLENQGLLFPEEEIKTPEAENPVLEFPQTEKPHLENPVSVNPSLEIEGHTNTINQRLSKQVLSSQILNNPREYKGASAQTRIQNQQPENPRYLFPDSWLLNFQTYYLKEHGSEMGRPGSEIKALNTLFETSKGNWALIESKIRVLKQLRKQDSTFWYEQSLSPESISKYWSRLFERKEKHTEKNIKRNEQQNQSIRNERKSMPDKPIEIKDVDPYKCFLVWGKTKLFKSQLEYYEQNSDPLKYEGTKKMLFEKFINEVYPGLVRNSEVKKSTIENRKENSKGCAA
ncbi:helix-turn-helix domain-containing protein [Leptospira santarosai]|uniref:helix-turn-helix domain-containing protein n=1 Tax=Leptospira santarosai TaxID=28183 RepID=UPI00077441FC|nr:helix-turn-helix domain-containing protein [Leptospira santarosai]